MLGPVRALAKSILQLANRALHPWRRAQARRALNDAAPVTSVLFLCLGNVCRSPYAAASFRRRAPAVRSDSAGFIGPGRSAADETQLVAGERGLDLSTHVSKVVTRELADDFDLVVVADPKQVSGLRQAVGAVSHVVVLGDLDSEPSGRRAIPDPWGHSLDTFRSSFDRIDRCLGEMVPFVKTTPK